MGNHSIKVNGIPTGDQFYTLNDARDAARAHNEIKPEDEYAICLNGKVLEVWVGPVTFMAAGPDAWVAYSSADIDSIGAVRKAGSVFSAGNRGADVGTFATLYSAAIALHEHASGNTYRYA